MKKRVIDSPSQLEDRQKVHNCFRKCSHDGRMYKLVRIVIGSVRLMGAFTATLGLVSRVGGNYGLSIGPISGWAWLGSVYDFLTWTPVFALSLIIVGTWLSEIFDAVTYRVEGSPTFWGTVLLWSRMRFTRAVLARPGWYPNEGRIRREVDRTNKALSKAHFATLEDLPTGPTGDVSTSVEYLSVAGAMIWALGTAQAATMSFGTKALLLTPATVRPTAVISLPNPELVLPVVPATPAVPPSGLMTALLRLIGRD